MSFFTNWGFDSQRSGANLFAGGLVSTFSPAAGSYLSNYESRMAQEAAIQKQHEWEVEENQKDRDWQERMFGLNNEEWTRRFNYENDYSAMAARLRAAGINPSAFFGDGNSGVASPASPSYSAGSHSLSSLGLPVASGVGGSSIFSTVAQLMDSYSKLKSTDLNEQRQKATLGAEVDKIISEASRNYSESALTDTLNSIKEVYGKTREAYELARIVADGYKAYAEGDSAKAAEINQKALSRLNTVEATTKEKSLPLVLGNLKRLGDVYESEQKKNAAQASEAYSGAERNKAEARHSSAQAEYQEFSNRMRNEFKQEEYDAYVDKLWRDDMLSRAEYEEAKRRSDVIKNSRRNSFTRALDNALEYLKEKVSIFK